MTDKIKSILEGKKIMILGYGHEGQSTFRLIKSWFPDMFITVSDQDEGIIERYPDMAFYQNTGMVTGDNYLDFFEHFDLVIKSPGIPYDLVAAKCDASKITSQTDLFLRAYSDRVTGVTGTKGKSTTVSLIHHILHQAGQKALMAGNIGIPPLDLADAIAGDTEVIFEMSSHQLEHISIAPQTAVLLNVFPEHLDHYKDFTAYKMAKFNISHMQHEQGKLIYNADDPFISELLGREEGEKTFLGFSNGSKKDVAAYYDGTDMICEDANGTAHHFPHASAPGLPGEHNVMNMMAAILVCMSKGLTDNEIISGLSSYKRLSHRLEFVGTYKGIDFYDDSIATIPEASIAALNTLIKVDLLILGGYDRGLDYAVLLDKLLENPLPHLLFMGDAGRRLHALCEPLLAGKSICLPVEGMDEAFQYISEKLLPGDVCLLSPAAASYGMFKNFEERGEVFQKMAAAL